MNTTNNNGLSVHTTQHVKDLCCYIDFLKKIVTLNHHPQSNFNRDQTTTISK